jgi:hypothetical protein
VHVLVLQSVHDIERNTAREVTDYYLRLAPEQRMTLPALDSAVLLLRARLLIAQDMDKELVRLVTPSAEGQLNGVAADFAVRVVMACCQVEVLVGTSPPLWCSRSYGHVHNVREVKSKAEYGRNVNSSNTRAKL